MREASTCGEVLEQLTDLLEDASPPSARRRLRKHLLQCQRCTRDLTELHWTIDQLRSIPPERISPTSRAVLLRALHARQSA